MMGRLTERDEQGNWSLKGIKWEQLYDGQVITKELRERLYGALCKLKDYEDTGLKPVEVATINDLVINQAEAMEKQVPQEPVYEGDGYAPDGTFIWDEWLCPRCRARYEVDFDDYNYCPNCGQRIKWEEK